MMNLKEARLRPVAETVVLPARVAVDEQADKTEDSAQANETVAAPTAQSESRSTADTPQRQPVRIRTEAVFDLSTIRKLNVNDLD